MTDRRAHNTPGLYLIRVRGTLDSQWADWFDGFTLTPEPQGETLLAGRVADQAALHGMLAKIRDLGLPLLSVQRVEGVDRPAGIRPVSGDEERGGT